MGLITNKCPNCGANVELDESQDIGFCKYCGTKVIREQPSVQKIKIENPIKIDGKVELVNNEFESKLAQVELSINEYKSQNGFWANNYYNNIIVPLIQQLRELGANDCRFYLAVMEIISLRIDKLIVGMQKTNTSNVCLNKNLINEYDTALKTAIKYAKTDNEKKKVKSYEEKQEILHKKFVEWNNEALAKIKVNKRIMKWSFIIGGIIILIMFLVMPMLI